MPNNFRYPFEFLLLIGLVIVLPLFEPPKNLLWLAFVVTWLVNRSREKDWGGRWDNWDSLILTWILSGYVVAIFAGLHNSEWRGANDILRYGAVLWMVKRSGYEKIQLTWLTPTIILSSLIALGYTLWNLYIAKSSPRLELNSVGHINHSAIYLAISYAVALAALLAFWRHLNTILKICGLFAVLALSLAVLMSASRAAVGLMFITTLMFGLVWLRRSKPAFVILLSVLLITAAAAYFAQLEVVRKQQQFAKENIILSYRDLIWNSALAAWEKYPLFGVGMDNFNQIDPDKIKNWREAAGKSFDAARYHGTAHAHSLYLNTLAERGLFGLGVLLTVLVSWLAMLFRYLPSKHDEDLEWTLWGGAAGAWLVSVGVGFVNTTLHHEHGLLSVLLLGMWLAYLNRKGKATQRHGSQA